MTHPAKHEFGAGRRLPRRRACFGHSPQEGYGEYAEGYDYTAEHYAGGDGYDYGDQAAWAEGQEEGWGRPTAYPPPPRCDRGLGSHWDWPARPSQSHMLPPRALPLLPSGGAEGTSRRGRGRRGGRSSPARSMRRAAAGTTTGSTRRRLPPPWRRVGLETTAGRSVVVSDWSLAGLGWDLTASAFSTLRPRQTWGRWGSHGFLVFEVVHGFVSFQCIILV